MNCLALVGGRSRATGSIYKIVGGCLHATLMQYPNQNVLGATDNA